MGIRASAQPLGYARQDAIPAGGRRGEDDGGLGGFRDGFGSGGVAGVTRSGEVGALDTQERLGTAGGGPLSQSHQERLL